MVKIKNKTLSNILDYFIKGTYAGILIGIGGTVYLSVQNTVAGSFLFSIGLLTICMYQMNLYTGKVGYVLVNKASYLIELLFSLIGNFAGTFIVGFLMRLTRQTSIIERANTIVNAKISDNMLSILILSVFCGMLMYIAVNNYKTCKDEIGKYIGIFMCVMTFILSGFEHCVANMYYFFVSNVFNLKVLLYLLIMVLGNSIGSIVIAYFFNTYKKD